MSRRAHISRDVLSFTRLLEHRPAAAEYEGELTPSAGSDNERDIDMVYGIAPVLNAMRNSRREKLTLYSQDGLAPANKKDKAAAGAIYDLARETGVP